MVRSTIRRTLCVVGAVAALTTFRRRSAQCADILPRERELIRFVIQFFINSRVFLKQILKHFRLKRAALLIRSSLCLAVVGEVPPSAHHGHWPSSPHEGGQPQVPQRLPRRHAAQAEAAWSRRPIHGRRHQVDGAAAENKMRLLSSLNSRRPLTRCHRKMLNRIIL